MISFALGELGCTSLDYVYDMTWAEFMIRRFAYYRINKSEWYKVREIAYNALIAPHYDYKKLPKTREAFMRLEEAKRIEHIDLVRRRIEEAKEDYKKQKAENERRIKGKN